MATLKKEEDFADDTNAVLGRGTSFEGKLVFEGEVRIAGRFLGEIYSEDRLQIDSSAEVQAEIHAGVIVVYGNVIGNLYASKLIELKANAHVVGNIETPALMVEQGVIFEGSCRMENLGQQPEAAVPSVNEAVQDASAAVDIPMTIPEVAVSDIAIQ